MNKRIDQYIKNFYQDESTGHDYSHSKRVEHLALKIAKAEGYEDQQYISLVALLHDIDDHKFTNHIGEFIHTKELLQKEGYTEELIRRICKDIAQISYSQNKGRKPDSLASQIVQDADRLDAIGAIGLSRCIMYSSVHNRPLYYDKTLNEDKEIAHHTTIGHYYEKLIKLNDLMNTKTGKTYALERNQTMHDFIQKIKQELND